MVHSVLSSAGTNLEAFRAFWFEKDIERRLLVQICPDMIWKRVLLMLTFLFVRCVAILKYHTRSLCVWFAHRKPTRLPEKFLSILVLSVFLVFPAMELLVLLIGHRRAGGNPWTTNFIVCPWAQMLSWRSYSLFTLFAKAIFYGWPESPLKTVGKEYIFECHSISQYWDRHRNFSERSQEGIKRLENATSQLFQ